MKTIQNCRNIFVAAVFVSLLAACEAKNTQTEFEARERGKIGKVYDPAQQGNLHENRENQFPSSRNSNGQGMEGLETGAKTDTTKVAVTPASTTTNNTP